MRTSWRGPSGALINGTDDCRVGTVFFAALTKLLDTATLVGGATRGNIQLFDAATRSLAIVVQRGFGKEFLEFFAHVHEGEAACGATMMSGKRVVVEDVTDSPIFFRTPALELMLDAGARAVQSTPLFDGAGRLVGVLSTHYREPRSLEEDDLRQLDVIARRTAQLIIHGTP